MQNFEEIYATNAQKIYAIIQKKLWNAEEADDVSQLVWLRVHRALDRGTKIQDEGGWVYTVAINVVRDWGRTKKSSCMFPLHQSLESSLIEESFDHEVAEQEERDFQRGWIQQQLGSFSALDQELFALRYEAGKKTGEIASYLGVSKEKVKIRLWRGVQKLRKKHQYGR